MDYLWRFLIGGLLVSTFALAGDVVRPRGFAGLFGAAPSVALATLALTMTSDGKPYAALEARSMIAGALAFLVYAVVCWYLIGVKRRKVAATSYGLLSLWAMVAFGLWSWLLR